MGPPAVRAKHRPAVWGGVECTINRVGDRFVNQCEMSGHSIRWKDLELFQSLGIETIRYPFLWELISPIRRGEYDWSWADERMRALAAHGLRPIAGLLHHGSGPAWTNLLDPEFPESFASFAESFARRYPGVHTYTPVNEPLTTARFSCLYGLWYPHVRNDRSFVRALYNELKATALAMTKIRRINPTATLVQTEDLGRAQGTELLAYQVEFENQRRWLTYDLLCGRVSPSHDMYEYLTECGGLSAEELEWFEQHPCPPNVLGINHYVLSNRFLDERLDRYPEGFHGGNGRHRYADVGAVHVADVEIPLASSILEETYRRYEKPVAITEVHIDGTRETQLRWFNEIWQEASQAIDRGIPVEAVTAWSLLGSFDWNSLCTVPARYYESGVFDVRGSVPRPTALAEMVRSLAHTGTFDHPVLSYDGWWRAPKRVIFPGPFVDPYVENRDVRSSAASSSKRPPLLVTGATGTLGRAIARLLNARAIPYRLCSRQDLDIANPSSIRRCLDETRPWAVINAAGFVNVDLAESERERCRRENTEGPALLAAEAYERGLPFLTFSSDLVFDGALELPYLEDADTRPLNEYGRSKAEAERRVFEVSNSALIVRTSAFFGPWDEYNFVTLALRELHSGRCFAAPADVTVSPTYVPDLVNLSLDHLIDGSKGILHLANHGEITWADLAREAAVRMRLDTGLIESRRLQDFGWPALRPHFSVLGSRYGRQMPSLERALDRYFDELSVPLAAALAV